MFALLLLSQQASAAVAYNDSFTVNASILTCLNVTANDTGNGTLRAGEVGTPLHGTAVVNDNGTINYTSTAGYLGNDTFNYTVTENTSLYFNGTGHYYEFVTSNGITWHNANTSASNRTLYGLQGYLVTITSAAESTFVMSKLAGEGWMGASDNASEGAWFWVTGPEAGTQFWQGTGGSGSVVNGSYNNWETGEPNDWGVGEDYAHFRSDGKWNDYPNSNSGIAGYVVEYGGMPGDTPVVPTGYIYITVVDEVKPSTSPSSPANGYYNDTAGNQTITFNCTATDNYGLANLTLYITNSSNASFSPYSPSNASGTSNSSSWAVQLGNGIYTWGCLAYDSLGNFNWSSNRSLTLNFTDSDSDGVADYLDALGGNSSYPSVSGVSGVNVTVNGSAANGTFSGVQGVNISSGGNPILNFTHNFSRSALNLSNITITLSSNSLIINMGGQLQSDTYGKTIYLADSDFASLCVKNSEVTSISEMSSGCNGANETDFTSCIGNSTGVSIGGITCAETSGTFIISNLTASAVRGTQAPQVSLSGGSPSKSATLSSSFDCASGSLNITATDSGTPISGIRVSLTESGNFASRMFSTTDSNGIAAFSIISEGDYYAEVSGAYYGTSQRAHFAPCQKSMPEQEIQPVQEKTIPVQEELSPSPEPPQASSVPPASGQNQTQPSPTRQAAPAVDIMPAEQPLAEQAEPSSQPSLQLALFGVGLLAAIAAIVAFLIFTRKRKRHQGLG